MLNKLDIETIDGMIFPENSSCDIEEQNWAIDLSSKIIDYLRSKTYTHNRSNPESKTNITQLKKVFANSPFETYPKSNILPIGVAYVNNFLRLKRSKWDKDLYSDALDLNLDDDDIKLAQKELEGTSLHNLFASSFDDLYIENYEKTKSIDWFEV